MSKPPFALRRIPQNYCHIFPFPLSVPSGLAPTILSPHRFTELEQSVDSGQDIWCRGSYAKW